MAVECELERALDRHASRRLSRTQFRIYDTEHEIFPKRVARILAQLLVAIGIVSCKDLVERIFAVGVGTLYGSELLQ